MLSRGHDDGSLTVRYFSFFINAGLEMRLYCGSESNKNKIVKLNYFSEGFIQTICRSGEGNSTGNVFSLTVLLLLQVIMLSPQG